VLRQLLALEDPTAAVTALVDAALEAGAPDNVTCVVADIVDLPEAPTTGIAVVVGAAGERRVRERLSSLSFPVDAQPDPEGADSAAGPPTAEVPITRVPVTKRRRNWTPLLLAVIAIAVLVTGLTIARTWIQNQWYVGNSGGVVTIYQGIPYSLGPFNLSTVQRSSTTAVNSLPDIYRSSVEATIGVPDLAAAEQKVADLEAQSAACAKSPSTNGCPPIAPVQS
jgi:protein phosphatase